MTFSEGPSDPLLDLVWACCRHRLCFLSFRIELSCIDTTEMILSDWCDTAQCNAQVTWANWPMVLGGVKIRNSQCWLLLLTYIAIIKWKCFVKSISTFPDLLVFIKKDLYQKGSGTFINAWRNPLLFLSIWEGCLMLNRCHRIGVAEIYVWDL